MPREMIIMIAVLAVSIFVGQILGNWGTKKLIKEDVIEVGEH